MMRVVLDTNVVVSALRSRQGASFEVMRRVALHRLKPLATNALYLEYEAVLKRPEQRLVHGLSNATIDVFLAEFAGLAGPVDVHFLWRPQLTDPADELVLEAMVNGRGDFLLTHNMRDFSRAAARFGIEVMTPATFLEKVR